MFAALLEKVSHAFHHSDSHESRVDSNGDGSYANDLILDQIAYLRRLRRRASPVLDGSSTLVVLSAHLIGVGWNAGVERPPVI